MVRTPSPTLRTSDRAACPHQRSSHRPCRRQHPHPNRSVDELSLGQRRPGRLFPVGPADEASQQAVLDALIAQTVAGGAPVVVLPELCVTGRMAERLQRWVERPDGPSVLVAGSFHHRDHGRGRNTAVVWVRGVADPLLHDKHSPGDRPLPEDIEPDGRPELRVYVADGWHLVVAICPDLLNPEVVHALAELGANLVLVPAMSGRVLAFAGQAAELVGSCQAVVAVANNPASHGRAEARPAGRRSRQRTRRPRPSAVALPPGAPPRSH